MLLDKKGIDFFLNINDIFGTWTAVVFGAVTLVIGVTIYNSFKSSKEVKNVLDEYKKVISEYEIKLKKVEELEKRLDKSYKSNNVLSSVILHIAEKDYYIAKNSLEKLLKLDGDNILYNYYYAKCLFLSVHEFAEDNEGCTDDERLAESIEAINIYLKILKSITKEQQETYNLGWVFPNSNIHELNYLSSILLNSDVAEAHFETIKEVLFQMKKELNVEKIEDFAFIDQTDVTFMQYRDLLKKLGLKMISLNNSFGNKIIDEYLTISSYSKYYVSWLDNDNIIETLDDVIEYNRNDKFIKNRFIKLREQIVLEIEEYEDNSTE